MIYLVKTAITVPEDLDQTKHEFERKFDNYEDANKFSSTIAMLIIAHRQSFSGVPLLHSIQDSPDKIVIIETNTQTNSTYPLATIWIERDAKELN